MLCRVSTGLSDAVGASATGAFCDADVFTPLQPHLKQLWALWELVSKGRHCPYVVPIMTYKVGLIYEAL